MSEGVVMGDLSVFVDESGDPGFNTEFYLVTFVFHDQSDPIDNDVARLAGRLANIGFPVDEPVHCAPAVRREGLYNHMALADRRKVFNALFNFTMHAGVTHATLAYRKSELGAADPCDIAPALQARIARDLGLFLGEHLGHFAAFDRVIVYYDNGQAVVARSVREAFTAKLFGVDFRRVRPGDYRLFQVADLVCTLELLRLKDEHGELSRSELAFFGSPGRLRRNYLRQIERLRLG